MTDLTVYHQSLGATLADDGIPLHYGNLSDEYQSVLNGSILLDRSHEGRILLTGDDRFELVNRMSTNKVVDMQEHEGRATIFTNATARILYRVVAYNRPEGLLILTEPGQGEIIANYLQRSIFYGDNVKVINLQQSTSHFALHGTTANPIMNEVNADLSSLPPMFSKEIQWHDTEFTVVKRKSVTGDHWAIICSTGDATVIHQHLMAAGEKHNLKPAGSLTFNTLRIRSGRPAGRELSQDYIPLEVGLWDEISFNKGCYTGQEIIARMESRERLAKTIIKLQLSEFVPAPTTLYHNNQSIGILTSSVEAPDGELFAIGVVKTNAAHKDTQLTVGDQHISAKVLDYAGTQPSFIHE